MQSLDKGPDSIASGNAKAEDVLRDLVTRGGELMQSRERMAGLLEAVVALAEDLSLDAVLERLVQSACTLLHARYGALGVMGEDNTLNHFVTVGIDAAAAARIGRQPTGHGVMGLLVSDPKPLRLHKLGAHPEATGFPPNHPPMNTFLGVPIRVRDKVFGNLYLTEKAGGEDFSDEDEALAVALAAAAAVAIENATLYDDARRRARWLEASMDVTGTMLAGDGDHLESDLDPIAERARLESQSRLALIVAPADSAAGHVVVGAAGEQAADFSGAPLLLNHPELQEVLAGGEPVLFPSASSVLELCDDHSTGPLLAVGLSARGSHHGLLLLAREPEAAPYDRTDREMGAVFGSHVALAMELARVHRLREELLVFTDRDRIARDLHDLVIQRLFAAGLSVQSLARFTKDDLATERIRNITGELDEAIRSLRDTIYSLRHSQTDSDPLSGRIRRVARSSAKSLPFTPRLTLTGPIDTVPAEKADNVVAVVSEGLSNAIRHSGADAISVSVAVVKGRVTVVVTDNGSGFTNAAARNGLANLEDRARMLDGECVIVSAPDEGTSVEWSVPL